MLLLRLLATPATTKKTQSCLTNQVLTEAYLGQHSLGLIVTVKKKMKHLRNLIIEELKVVN